MINHTCVRRMFDRRVALVKKRRECKSAFPDAETGKRRKTCLL